MSSQATQQITTTLHALLPTYTSPSGEGFPRPLVQLTQSLLQRSRSRVPNLRNGEEEAARVWCVAEVACNRLKGRLNLPRIQGRPPCAPKVYKRLYKYLEGALSVDERPAGSATPHQPNGTTAPSSKSRAKAGNVAGVEDMPLRTVTPLKRSLDMEITPISTPEGSRKRKAKDLETEALETSISTITVALEERGTGIDETLDASVVSMIRGLCTSFNVPAATPHVYVGVKSIISKESAVPSLVSTNSAPKKRAAQRKRTSHTETPTAIARGQFPILIITVLLAVLEEMNALDVSKIGSGDEAGGDEIDGEIGRQHYEARQKAIDHFVEMKALDKRQTKTADRDIEDLEEMAEREGWWDLDWFKNIPRGPISSVAPFNGLRSEEDSDLDEEEPIDGKGGSAYPLVAGAGAVGRGCLMQDRFDWLSDDRKRDFEKWKADILKRIEAKERHQQLQAQNLVMAEG